MNATSPQSDTSATDAKQAAKPCCRRRTVWSLALVAILAAGAWWNYAAPPDDEPIEVSQSVTIGNPAEPVEDVTKSNEPVTADNTAKHSEVAEEAAIGGKSPAIDQLISQAIVEQAEHPLDPVLKVATWSIQHIDKNIADYSCQITSQVFMHDRLAKERQMIAKIRHAATDGDSTTPFSVYLNFSSPRSVKDQEVIWVDGQNDGKLVAHVASGFLKLKRMYLEPEGPLAMRDSKYPIWDIGFRNLIAKMYDIGCEDRDKDDCRVIVTPGVTVEDRRCTLIEIIHDEPRECFQFHHAKIYVDDERKIPIGYEGYQWPDKDAAETDPLPLIEKFYYTDLQLNQGYTDADFDPNNKAYHYPSW